MQENQLKIIFLLSAIFLFLSPLPIILSANDSFNEYVAAGINPVVAFLSPIAIALYAMLIPGIISLLYFSIKRKNSKYLLAMNVILGLFFLFVLPVFIGHYFVSMI